MMNMVPLTWSWKIGGISVVICPDLGIFGIKATYYPVGWLGLGVLLSRKKIEVVFFFM